MGNHMKEVATKECKSYTLFIKTFTMKNLLPGLLFILLMFAATQNMQAQTESKPVDNEPTPQHHSLNKASTPSYFDRNQPKPTPTPPTPQRACPTTPPKTNTSGSTSGNGGNKLSSASTGNNVHRRRD